MMNIQAIKTENDIDELIRLAHIIWPEHYTAIIGSAQVEYMLAAFHGKPYLQAQIENDNFHYFLIKHEAESLGYIGVQVRDGEVFLSKLYVLSSARGRGVGKLAMNFVMDFARQLAAKCVTLTVNKYNTNTIAAYHKMGFVTTGEICVDIGEGYQMDDYEMALAL